MNNSRRTLIKGGLTLGASAMIIPTSSLMALPEDKFYTRGLTKVPVVEHFLLGYRLDSIPTVRRCVEVFVRPSDVVFDPTTKGMIINNRDVILTHDLGTIRAAAGDLPLGGNIFYSSTAGFEKFPTPSRIIQSTKVRI